MKHELDKLTFGAETIAVAYSGGKDSTALLLILREYLKERPQRLVCLHVNHMIRGADADADEAHCRAVCERLGVELFVHRVNVPEAAKRLGIGLEEAARIARYDFFADFASKNPHALVATAHTADDNFETVFFNLVRGAASRGLAGIPPKRGIYIRPLLGMTGEQCAEYCKAAGEHFVCDRTNTDTGFTRNYIRYTIAPAAKKINPKYPLAVKRSARHLKEDDDFIRMSAAAALGECARETSANAALLRGMPRALFARAFCIIYENAAGTRSNLSSVNIDDAYAFLHSGKTGRLSLANGFCAIFGEAVSIEPDARQKAMPCDYRLELTNMPQPLPGCDFSAFIAYNNEESRNINENIYKLVMNERLLFDKIKGKIFVRTRRPGDTFLSGGMHKSLKNIFASLGIRGDERLSYPLFCDDGGILWIPGYRVRDGVRAPSNEKSECVLLYLCEKKDCDD